MVLKITFYLHLLRYYMELYHLLLFKCMIQKFNLYVNKDDYHLIRFLIVNRKCQECGGSGLFSMLQTDK